MLPKYCKNLTHHIIISLEGILYFERQELVLVWGKKTGKKVGSNNAT